MKKLFSLSMIVLFLAAPLFGAQCQGHGMRIVDQPGVSLPVGDGRWVNETGDTGMTGTHDYSIAILIAADAAAAGHVVTRSFGDGRYPQLAAATNTFTGLQLLPDGTSTDPSLAFASETGTGFHLAKVGRIGISIDGTGTVVTLDTSTFAVGVGFTVDGNTTLGDVIGDTVTFNAGTWNILNLLTANFSSDFVLNVGANTMTINAVAGGVEINAPSVFDGTFEIKGTDGIEFSPGAGVDMNILSLLVAGAPTLKWVTALDKFEFTKNIIVPDGPPIVVVFGGGTDVPYFNTTNIAYTTVGAFLFGGTTALNTPSKIKAIGFKDAGPTSWDVRVLDITNTTTIATKTGNTGTAPEIVDLGTLTSLPAAEAIFEVQIKRAGGLPADFVYIHNVTIEF